MRDIKNISIGQLKDFITSIGLKYVIKIGFRRCKDLKNMILSREYLIIYTDVKSLYESIHEIVNNYCAHPNHIKFNKTKSPSDFLVPEVVKNSYEKKRDGDNLKHEFVYNNRWIKK